MAAYGKKSKAPENGAYRKLRDDLRDGTPERLYVFRGEERYLLEDAVGRLRAMIPEGTREFNHHRLEGRSLGAEALQEAVDALPVFAERTLTEIWDYDFGRLGEETRRSFLRILSDIPDYATVVFVCDTVDFKLDGRVKANAELKKLFTEVEFTLQPEEALMKWAAKNFAAGGKRIGRDAAARLVAMTGGLMTGMKTEVEKLISYVPGDTVTVRDVEAVVTPTPEAAAWELTDAILGRKNDLAMERLGELLLMDEAPHRILFAVSQKLRQLLAAKLCLRERVELGEYAQLAGVKHLFQARALYEAARRTELDRCVRCVEAAADAALKLNSASGDDRALLTELVARILL